MNKKQTSGHIIITYAPLLDVTERVRCRPVVCVPLSLVGNPLGGRAKPLGGRWALGRVAWETVGVRRWYTEEDEGGARLWPDHPPPATTRLDIQADRAAATTSP